MKLVVSGDRFFITRHIGLVNALKQHFSSVECVFSGNLLELLPVRVIARIARGTPMASRADRTIRTLDRKALGFKLRTQQTERRIRRANPDLVLHIFSSFAPFRHAPPVPYAMYLDYTMMQAREHWPAWANFSNGAEYARWISVEGSAYRNAAAIFTMSESTRRAVIDEYGVPSSKVQAVGSATEIKMRCPREQPMMARLLFYTSSEFDRKGGDIAVEAFRLLRQEIQNAELVIVGAGPEVVGPGITHVGYVETRTQMEELVRTCDVVIAPSRCDPFTTFVVEAMTLGVPCVVSRNTGVAELMAHGESGIVVDPLTPEIMFKELFSLLTSPQKARHVAEGAQHLVRDTLNWDAIARKVAEPLVSLHSHAR